MEIICAGFPKTGSKSCSSALRELGYNVADFAETGAYLTYQWTDFIDGKIQIEEVIEKGLPIFETEFYSKSFKFVITLSKMNTKNTDSKLIRICHQIFYGKIFTMPLQTQK